MGPVEEKQQAGCGVVTPQTPHPLVDLQISSGVARTRRPSGSPGKVTSLSASPVSLRGFRMHGLRVDFAPELSQTGCEEHGLGPAGAGVPHPDS